MVAITRLGDMLQMSPTIAGLKAENPSVRITVLIEKQFATICKGIPGIDEVYVIDLSYVVRCIHREQDGIVEGFKYVDDLVIDLRSKGFDYCLNMSNSSYTALLIKMLGIKDNRGWLSDDEGYRVMADPWAMLFSAFVYHSNRDFNSLNLVDIFRCAAEVKQHPHAPCYETNEDAQRFAAQFLEDNGVVRGKMPLVCLQAGASQIKRQWAPERFAKLLRLLIEDVGAYVVFTGSASEQHIVDEVLSRYAHPRAINAVGKTNVEQLAGLLRLADVLVTGDTGPMHLAVAVGTPVVAVFLASALVFETGPYSSGNFVLQPQIGCSPCNPNYPCARTDCHDQVTPEQVAYLTKLRLETPMGGEKDIRIPATIADARNVMVYRSDFDRDGFLEFYPMNETSDRHGEPRGFFETGRSTYRTLWKEELSDIEYSELPRSTEGSFPAVHPSLEGLYQAIELTKQGQRNIADLKKLIRDVGSPVRLLGEMDHKLQVLDKRLEEVSLSFPLLGALIRVFVMEKENLRGDDPMELASKMGGIYDQLLRRSERFGRLFVHFYELERRNSA